MTLTKLGMYLETYDERNQDRLDATHVVGISTSKEFIETKAKLDGVSLKSYKVVPPQHFAYVSDTSRRGEKISLSYNASDEEYLVSSISTVFKVIDNELLSSEFLFMYFNRPEFDRFSRYNSWGSARETFSWDDMCDIEIDLPPLAIQEKYVAVYQAMLANQKAYENGLEDLKLVCDGYFDKLKKDRSLYKRLGNFIEKNELRNSDKKLGKEHVRGISNKKEFMLTKADISKTDLSKFLVIPKNSFAYNSRTDGRDMLVLAINKLDEPVTVTWNYNSFNIIDNKIRELNPDYLYAFLKRAEFDRLVRFMSWGSSQELFSWDSLGDVKIPVPDIKIQNSIAQLYNVYLERKQINERLKQQIKEICPILIAGAIKEANSNA
ncbi:TPA: restriction endonuclease subunit S [Streptococcus equi subsp. zooepidemicus]|uniref:restriction endonuclease subunit S n=1 Tax=Streptococcus equi TaxID=1336 RepID=UPI000DA34F0D|nr:restriction endonuclease subunit S [Streptococcus equi]MCD3401808.1 restriction endonuclease subunit S [Streptococcus equi subsp. zooepidemicus]UFR16686.1 restriction endonuclease subunit S [Streptococcus equi subsp. zooepidemicus]SQG18065.1 Type I restriction modification DNA specificity domain [Streptococcus equi subsp. zooepidemicus]HEL0571194.1 restriction endonuclease subunit S [Streptococcus equi subsp. zooepidemicus]HEL0667814.1 restriction endonuclease subunit S [Streptococcus equi 